MNFSTEPKFDFSQAAGPLYVAARVNAKNKAAEEELICEIDLLSNKTVYELDRLRGRVGALEFEKDRLEDKVKDLKSENSRKENIIQALDKASLYTVAVGVVTSVLIGLVSGALLDSPRGFFFGFGMTGLCFTFLVAATVAAQLYAEHWHKWDET